MRFKITLLLLAVGGDSVGKDILRGGLAAALDLQKLHLKDKGGAGRDGGGNAGLTIGDVVGAGDLPLIAFDHLLKCLSPSGDHLVGGKVNGLAAGIGAVEDVAVSEAAFVVACAGGGQERGLASSALSENSNEKARGKLVGHD